MAKWAMVIDLDKCVACQGCSIACRFENNSPVVKPNEAIAGRSILWNDVFTLPVNHGQEDNEFPNVKTKYFTRPCMHCANPPCVKVCPVQATYIDEEGLVRQNYERCIGCRFCTVACPYGVRHFNWEEPAWEGSMSQYISPDRIIGPGLQEGPTVRERGVVEKCTFCIHRLHKARLQAEAENRPFRASDYVPACVQTCTGKARFFGDLDDPESTVSRLATSPRAFRILEDVGTHPKVIYLEEG